MCISEDYKRTFNDSEKTVCSKGHIVFENSHTFTIRKYKSIKYKKYENICKLCKKEEYLLSVKQKLTDFGYDLVNKIGESFDSRKTILEIKCKNGHISKRKYENICAYSKCVQCRIQSTSWFENLKSFGITAIEKTGKNTAKILYDNRIVDVSIAQICSLYYLNAFEIYRYKVLTVEENSKKVDRIKYLVNCSNNHEFVTTKRYLLEGHGCRKCSLSQTNEPELTISSWIENVGLKVERKVLIDNIELDIYCEEKKVAIEYCGIRWHSVEFSKNKNIDRHQSKTIFCMERGIHLITIFESEYIKDRQAMKDIVLDAISGNDINTNDLRYKKLLPENNYTEPKVHLFDRKYVELFNKEVGRRYTIYDCGHLLP